MLFRSAAKSSTTRDWELQDADWEREVALLDEHDGHPVRDLAEWPNNGLGFPSSRVDHSPVIPELEVPDGVPLQDGAEMWRIDRSGDEVLVGIYDTDSGGWISL